jgi:tRNA A-37 threonylcarbamoyl transferase component Bud32
MSLLGSGWEGEVYKVRERNTKIERAAKIFFPNRNLKNKTSNLYARKLHSLYHCPIVIQYHAEEEMTFRKTPVTVLISELVEGEILADFLKRQPGKRLSPFQALHLLHSLVVGLEGIHAVNEYHGDLHAENIIISRFGLSFELKLLDFFHWNAPRKENIQDDICDAIRVFYDTLGGQKWYSKQPDEVKYICCGLKRSIILKRYPRISRLRTHLETMSWE